MGIADHIRLRMADGSVFEVARDEAQILADRLHRAGSLDGALSLAAQLANELKLPHFAGGHPIELLRREERALRSVLGPEL